MSRTAAKETARRWLATAREDLEAARTLRAGKHHAHACFLAQQAAEKAVKALWQWHDHEPWGHSIQKLIRDFPVRESPMPHEELLQAAADLDKYYIPTRYPNGLPDLTPNEVYNERDSGQALELAALIINRVAQQINA